MVFSSASFLFYFLPVVLAWLISCGLCICATGYCWRPAFFFYTWGEGEYVVVMLLSIVANYLFGIWVYKSHERNNAKMQMGVAIAFNLLLLIIFKYTNFLVANLNLVLDAAGLPTITIGQRVSAYRHFPFSPSTAGISYLMDIYRRQTPPQMSLPCTALYISLFPQLVAGPIIRYKRHCVPAHPPVRGPGAVFQRHQPLHHRPWQEGADRQRGGLAGGQDCHTGRAFDHAGGLARHPLLYLADLFRFFRYSDMAIGLGHMFGFKFMENFNYPYISRSIQEFWRRWHISLSTWFRDYLYSAWRQPGGEARMYRNLVTIFSCAACGTEPAGTCWPGAFSTAFLGA